MLWGRLIPKESDNIKTPISWVGNKTSILPIIYSVFPLGYNRYIEPFGGSGAVLLGKNKPDKFEVYNDYNKDLVNLFLCIRERPMALIKELGFYPLNSRSEFKLLKAFFERESFEDKFADEEAELTKIALPEPSAEEIIELQKRLISDYDVRRAAMFLKLIRYSYSSTGTSYACQPFSIYSLFDLIEQVSKRLASVVIENQDFETLIKHYDRPDSLFYCDPPYVDTEHFYTAGFNMDDHKRLRNALFDIKGRFLLSYNDCEEVRKMYKGCDILGFTRTHSMAQKYEAGKKFHELLIANYDILEREKSMPYQISFFESGSNEEVFKILKESEIHHGYK